MLGMTADQTPRSKPSKKKSKHVEKRPGTLNILSVLKLWTEENADGITRELYALMGERAPPIPIAQPKQYKAKRARATTPVKW